MDRIRSGRIWSGVRQVDLLQPLVRGRVNGLVGVARSGKTTLALTAIAAQRDANVRCVYVCVGLERAAVALASLRASGSLAHTVVVTAPTSSTALAQLAARAGAAIADAFRAQGLDTLLVWDEAAPGDAVHAVTERVGPVGERGSVTALVLARDAQTIDDACDQRLTLDGRSYLVDMTSLPATAPRMPLGMLGPFIIRHLRDLPSFRETVTAAYGEALPPEVIDYIAFYERLLDVLRQPPSLVEPIERSLVRVCCVFSNIRFGEDVMAYLAREHGAVLDDIRRRGGLKRLSRDAPRDPLETALRGFTRAG